jgi:tight adherence protein C
MSNITVVGWIVLALFGGIAVGITLIFLRLYAYDPDSVGNESQDNWRKNAPIGFRLALECTAPFIGTIERLSSPRQKEYARMRLAMAGMSFALRPEEFMATRPVGFLAGLLFSVVFIKFFDTGVTATTFTIFLMVAVGTFYPDIVLNDQIKKRRKAINKLFPFFLDLLVLSLRAGLTLTTAMQQAVLKLTAGPLKEEVQRCLNDMRAGMPRMTALTRMSERVQVPAIGNFVAAVNQAEESGAAIAGTLEIQAEQRRMERFQEAERLGNQAPVKLMFPLMAFLFPLTFLILFFPIVVEILGSGAGAMLK